MQKYAPGGAALNVEQVTAAFAGRMKPGLKDWQLRPEPPRWATGPSPAALTRMPPGAVGLTQICVRMKSPPDGVWYTAWLSLGPESVVDAVTADAAATRSEILLFLDFTLVAANEIVAVGLWLGASVAVGALVCVAVAVAGAAVFV